MEKLINLILYIISAILLCHTLCADSEYKEVVLTAQEAQKIGLVVTEESLDDDLIKFNIVFPLGIKGDFTFSYSKISLIKDDQLIMSLRPRVTKVHDKNRVVFIIRKRFINDSKIHLVYQHEPPKDNKFYDSEATQKIIKINLTEFRDASKK